MQAYVKLLEDGKAYRDGGILFLEIFCTDSVDDGDLRMIKLFDAAQTVGVNGRGVFCRSVL